MLYAGAGTATVDLEGILPFDGFDEVRHPLKARALVLEAGQRICLLSMELTSIRGELLSTLRGACAEAAACAPENVWVMATHTFSAPHTRTPEHLATDDERARNVELAARYAAAVTQAASAAAATLVPATLACGEAPCAVNVNRDVETPHGWWLGHDPAGFSDHTVRVLAFIPEKASTPLAVVFSADVQSSVLDKSRTSAGARVVSGDLAGFAAGALERTFDGCVALFALGCAADQAPAEQAVTQSVAADGSVTSADAHEKGYRMLHVQGSQLASAVTAALEGARQVPCNRVTASTEAVTLPGQQRAEFSGLRPLTAYTFEPSAPVTCELSVLGLGEIAIAATQPELCSQTGATIRAAATERGITADVWTMVGGAAKYLPTSESYDRITYEAMNSGFAKGADALLSHAIIDALESARAAGRTQEGA